MALEAHLRDIDLDTLRAKLNSMAERLDENDKLMKAKLIELDTNLRLVAQGIVDGLEVSLRKHVQDTVVDIYGRIDTSETQGLQLQTATAALELRLADLEAVTLEQYKQVQGDQKGDTARLVQATPSLQQRVQHAEAAALAPQTAAAPAPPPASVSFVASAAGMQTSPLAAANLSERFASTTTAIPLPARTIAATALDAEQTRREAALLEEARRLQVEKACLLYTSDAADE